MPAILTHDFFGRDAYDDVSASRGFVTPQQRQAFLLGNQGPDPLFYLVADPFVGSENRVGGLMHHAKPARLLSALRDALTMLTRDERPVGDAYAAGFLCHYLLDRSMHPLVYAYQYALCDAGVPAMTLEVDEHRRKPQAAAERIVGAIFCKLTQLGIWTGEAVPLPAPETVIPCIRTGEDVCRVSCECPGIYEPQDRAGEWVAAGEMLGRVFDALTGEVRETITAPADGLVFSQRSYSPVYPGTLIARMFTGKCAHGGQNA